MVIFLVILGILGLISVGFISIAINLTKQGQATGENNRKRIEED